VNHLAWFNSPSGLCLLRQVVWRNQKPPNQRFQPTAALAALASRRLKREPLGANRKNFEKDNVWAVGAGCLTWGFACTGGFRAVNVTVRVTGPAVSARYGSPAEC